MTAEVRRRPGRLDAAIVAGSAVSWGSAASFPDADLLLVTAALVLFLAAWFTVGRRRQQGAGTSITLAVLVAACAAGAWTSPAFATFQIVAFPIAWLLAPTTRVAVGWNVAIALAIGVGYARGTSVPAALVVEAVSFGFSMAMGVWIDGIERRSTERQQLIDRLTAAQDQVATLGREAGVAAERERLARELHDTLAQSLAGIVMLAERARRRHPADTALGVLEDAARQAMAEARGLVTAGASVPLEGGLATALETLATRFRRETGLEVTVDAQGDVPRGLEVVLLRCAQEGLANVRKHARARSVALTVAGDGAEARLIVADDGRGPGDGSGFGLAGMRDRLALVGGSVELVAAPGGGATLVARVPIAASVAS